MQVYVERGANRGDCVHKIVKKHGIYFNILREKTIPSKLGGIIPEKVELEYYLSPQRGLGLPVQGSPLQGEAYPQYADSQYSSGRPAAASSAPAARPLTKPAAMTPALPRDDTTLDFVEAKKRVLAAAGKDYDQVAQQVQAAMPGEEAAQQLILDKLNEIQEKIGTGREQKPDHDSLNRIAEMLRLNDFSERYIAGILEKMRKELPLDILENFDVVQERVLVWIGESIKLFSIPENPSRLMVLIGPTGVGKTTTVAKLAAIYTMNSGRPSFSIRMITIDAFKIGARDQIEDFGDIMEIPVSYVDNHRDLRREIDLYREETDIILVDTIGRSPRDSAKLGEMKDLLDACGSKAEVHLVLAASTKTSDIEYALRQFEPFNYQAVLLTKLDETSHVGNIISALAERGKAISYITDGQAVHKDIKKASVVRFLINLDEFRVDREQFEKRFPAEEGVSSQLAEQL
ncbi:MAG: AAA family ATPase [Treponema sp.]|nr:AAA family ATPase [Treponema sp.]